MAEPSLNDLISEYEKHAGVVKDVPEAGAGHYLARGALQGISALADVVPNLYNLGKAAVGTVATAAGRPDLAPNVGDASPIANFLLRGYHLDEPVKPAPYLGRLGAAALEVAGAAVGQGPMGLAKGVPIAMVKELAAEMLSEIKSKPSEGQQAVATTEIPSVVRPTASSPESHGGSAAGVVREPA